MLLLLNEHGDPSFLFQNLSSYDINNQLAKFDKKSQCRFYFSGMTLELDRNGHRNTTMVDLRQRSETVETKINEGCKVFYETISVFNEGMTYHKFP